MARGFEVGLLGIILLDSGGYSQKSGSRSLGVSPTEIVMSEYQAHHNILIARLCEHLQAERYGRCASRNYPSDARRFLRYLARRGQSIESVAPADIDHYGLASQ